MRFFFFFVERMHELESGQQQHTVRRVSTHARFHTAIRIAHHGPQSAKLGCLYLLRRQPGERETLISSLEPPFHLPEVEKNENQEKKKKKACTIGTN